METDSTESTYAYAESFVQTIDPHKSRATVVALSGDLGSGKTVFAQGVARALGITETVTSPTFVIQKIYKIENSAFKRLVHIDAYRLEDAHELLVLGWERLLSHSDTLILIEWPERVEEILPKGTIRITCTYVDENTRKIERA